MAAGGAAAIAWSRAPAGGTSRGAAALALCLVASTAWTFSRGDHLPLRSVRTVARAAASQLRPGDTLVEYRDLTSGLPFYTGRLPLMVDIDRETEFETELLADRLMPRADFLALWEAPGRVLAVARPRRARDLPHATELARGGGYVLLTNH
jgi:hypothetical protein